MKHLRCILIIFSLILGGASAGMAQDFDKGVAAWEKKKWAAALREFVPLAQQGDLRAQFVVAEAYRHGKGVKKDYKLAAQWMRRSADQGFVNAQGLLGTMYYEGQGVIQDYAEASRWFRKASEQGDSGAQALLGLMYYEGAGVQQNNLLSHMWLNIAASNGKVRAAKDRDIVARKMTSVELAKAQKRASACVRKNYKGC